MGRISRLALAVSLIATSVGTPSIGRGQSTPPNLYQWLAANQSFSGLHPYTRTTRNFQWYWGCAAGLPGACQYVAVGKSSPSSGWLELFYDYTMLQTPAGGTYAMFDLWRWTSPDPNCTGVNDIIQLPTSCASVLSQMTWSTRIDTGFASGNYQSFGATFNPVTGASVTPEPATLALVGSGLLGLGGLGRWRSRRQRRV